MSQTDAFAFRNVPRTGVIFVMNEARLAGFSAGDASWCNFGQGQPEIGPLQNAPERIASVDIDVEDHEYGPVSGITELREAVAELYNYRYRQGKRSQYTAANVAISGGGRASLTRAVAALGDINLGHFLPDYTAYEELLEVFRSFHPIPILLSPESQYAFSADALRDEILGRGLGGLLLSNPCNPTGKVIRGEELKTWVETARALDCTMMFDEFYSHYIYEHPKQSGQSVSAAEFVDDVERDPIILFNGLTKDWRYPGWRVAWTVGPQAIIERISSAASFLDGGANRPLQRAAIRLLDKTWADQEMAAIQDNFLKKRNYLLSALSDLGVQVDRIPEGSFYVWANLSKLPPAYRDGMDFFRAALEHRVIVVPGEFFDVNPGKRRRHRASRFSQYARLSFGPPLSQLKTGIESLGRLLSSAA